MKIKKVLSMLAIVLMMSESALFAGCQTNIVIETQDPSLEPTKEDTITPGQKTTPVVTPTPTMQATTPAATVTVTPSPSPSGPDEFGLTEARKKMTVMADYQVSVGFFEVDGIQKIILLKYVAPNMNSDGVGIYEWNDLLSGDFVCEANSYDQVIKLSETYFKSDEQVTLLRTGQLQMLLDYLRIDPNNSDKIKPDDVNGRKTLEEMEALFKKIVDPQNWYTKQQNSQGEIQDRPDSLIPKDRDSIPVNSKDFCSLVIDYSDGDTKVVFAKYVKDDNGKEHLEDLFTGSYICDAELKNLNKEFFDSIKKNGKIKDMGPSYAKDFVVLPYAKPLTKPLREAKITKDYRLAYQLLPDKYWYIAPDPTKKMCNDIYNGKYDLEDSNSEGPIVLTKILETMNL